MIEFKDVFKSYNGKSGCMCGCRGAYKLPTAFFIKRANEDSGWEAYDKSNVSPRAVKIAIKKINEAIATGNTDAKIEYDSDGDACWAYVDDGSRNTTVYFTNYIMKGLEKSRARKANKA